MPITTIYIYNNVWYIAIELVKCFQIGKQIRISLSQIICYLISRQPSWTLLQSVVEFSYVKILFKFVSFQDSLCDKICLLFSCFYNQNGNIHLTLSGQGLVWTKKTYIIPNFLENNNWHSEQMQKNWREKITDFSGPN